MALTSAADRITKARVYLLNVYPFYGILSLKLQFKKVESKMVEDENGNMVEETPLSTAGVDGKYFYYNENFINKLTDPQLRFIVVHEVMHCALRHLWRQEHRLPQLFNVACDFAIHSILKQDGCKNIEMLQENICYDPKYNGMSAEEIYEDLLKQTKDQKNIKYTTVDSHSMWGSGSKESKQQQQSMAQDWEASVINAAKQAMGKKPGSMPGYFQRMVDELVNPIKDWRILLREFIEPEPSDYTFIRPDYRIDFDTFGCFLPSFNEEDQKVEDIYFWIDTSGSISNDDLNYIYSEVAGAIQQFDKFTGYLGFFDSEAYEPKRFEDINSLKEIKPVGGGGTSFYAAFEYMNDHNITPKCVIMLTDGYANFPDTDIIDCPVIWLITTKEISAPEPWRSIYLPLEEHK